MVHKEPLILLVITIFYSCDFLQLVVLYCVTLIYCCTIVAAVLQIYCLLLLSSLLNTHPAGSYPVKLF